ncbi:MAG: EF-hand domain-containing protein [Fimbriiglobus sp.]|nr:EF-hand domain-containing protein [Fimbriiglobus sp.]
MLPVLVAAVLQATPATPPPASLCRPQFGPKVDAFVPGSRPHSLQPAGRPIPPFRRRAADRVVDTFELVFLARTHPVRVRVVAHLAGRSLGERCEAHLRDLFTAFDRDGDGTLNRYECDLIFSKGEFRSMLAGGFAFRGQSGELPTLDALDRDDDGRVSFDELAEYYTPELAKLTAARPSYARLPDGDQYTPELFARLDKNRDGKLTADELKEAEKILTPLDADEDETVSGAELLATSARPARLGGAGDGMAMNGMMGSGKDDDDPRKQTQDVLAHLGPLPGTVVQAVLKRYDANSDFELSEHEVGFDEATFDRLDVDKNDKLSATELDAWRTGEPDAVVTLTIGPKVERCKAEARVVGKGSGLTVPQQGVSDRVVLRVGAQTLDFAAVPVPEYARTSTNPYGYLFPTDKKYLTEQDLVGPQYQFLRVAFEPADFDGDGRLTRGEFDRYFALQQSTSQLGLTLTHAVQVPNLFQLLDSNGDGRLSVKELRTAYARLAPLQPDGGKEITRAILQPSLAVRLGSTIHGAADMAVYAVSADPATGRVRAVAAGPVWFRKMDRNGDGDVSRVEFLGSREQFNGIDANGDGIITPEEAEAFDARVRPKKER